MDLESIELEGIELGYAEFMEFAEADYSGHLDPENFGRGFEIKADGIYVKPLPPDIVLTREERAALTQHPRGRPDEPALAFPFTPRELKTFLDWAARVGDDVPIDEDALHEVIEAQKTQPTLIAASPAMTANQSDASLGAHIRQRNRAFAEKNHERREARAVEHQRWRDAAAEIQRKRQRPASKRELASLVKKHLDLSDSEDTIRKRLAEPNLGSG
ncbi:hypothetical protein [Azotobacter salinestris]|uniref:hypothetical protein n=1 Tax=Azotobacter salinestris TaxID=69964 RepID=UPI0032E0060E